MPDAPPTEPSEVARLGRVTDKLRRAAGSDGFLPFDRFLEIALYDPDDGYFRRPGERARPDGDYYTAPHVHPIFGATIGERVWAEVEALGRPERFVVVELGPGDGTLAEGILTRLASRVPAGSNWEYRLVEPGGVVDPRVVERVTRAAGGQISVTSAIGLGSEGPFAGVVVANEVLDALPFRRFRLRGGHWAELGVVWRDGSWRPQTTTVEPGVPGLPAVAHREDGDECESSALSVGLIREAADHLERGAAIFLDYGGTGDELASVFARGSVRAVRSHRPLADPLDAPGSADVSRFVDFTPLRSAGSAGGLTERAYRPQAEALAAWGIERLRPEFEARAAGEAERVRLHLALKNLALGFERFRVLELAAEGRTTSSTTARSS